MSGSFADLEARIRRNSANFSTGTFHIMQPTIKIWEFPLEGANRFLMGLRTGIVRSAKALRVE